MAWRLTTDVVAYRQAVWDLLARNPVEQTVALSVIESVRAGHRWSEHSPLLFGWFERAGEVRGAVLMTPPHELLLAVVPDDTVPDLADALLREGASVPGVNGDTRTARRFASAWERATGRRPVPRRRMRLFRLEALRPPAPAPAGGARRAGPDDLETAARWVRAFETEAGVPATDVESAMRIGIGDGRVWLWQDEASAGVALAGRTPTAGGVARIAPVYTPLATRRRGYGAAVTAACTRDALELGADGVVLFTDLANPTANSIYQRIGFAPVRDYDIVHFTG